MCFVSATQSLCTKTTEPFWQKHNLLIICLLCTVCKANIIGFQNMAKAGNILWVVNCRRGFAAMQVTDIFDPPVNSFCILLCTFHFLHNLWHGKIYSAVSVLLRWSWRDIVHLLRFLFLCNKCSFRVWLSIIIICDLILCCHMLLIETFVTFWKIWSFYNSPISDMHWAGLVWLQENILQSKCHFS
jgi:hypothetical protein